MASEKVLLDLIGRIYDAAEHPEQLSDALDRVGDALQSIANCLTFEDLSNRQSSINLSSKVDPHFQRTYNEHYQSVNLHIIRARPLFTPGRVVSSHTLCTDDEVLRSEYYQDFLRPQDWFYPFGGRISSTKSSLAVVNFLHSRRQGPCTPEQQGLLEALLPHFARAIRLHQTVGTALAAMDLLPTGILITSGSGKVLFHNAAAHRLIGLGDGLTLSATGLVCADRRANSELRRLLAQVAQTSKGQGTSAGGVVAVNRISSKRPYSIVVSPIRWFPEKFGSDQARVILFVSDPESGNQGIEAMARNLYGLTTAEARLARILTEGRSLDDACDELHIRRTTARTQLRSVFDKLGVNRQAELVALLLRSVVLVHP